MGPCSTVPDIQSAVNAITSRVRKLVDGANLEEIIYRLSVGDSEDEIASEVEVGDGFRIHFWSKDIPLLIATAPGFITLEIPDGIFSEIDDLTDEVASQEARITQLETDVAALLA